MGLGRHREGMKNQVVDLEEKVMELEVDKKVAENGKRLADEQK